MPPTIARAVELAAQLDGAGIPATLDPRQLAGMAPAVLLRPPSLSFDGYAGPTASWSLLAVASTTNPLAAWEQLDALVDQVADVLHVESADPVSFAASATDDALPAYALTLTD